MELSRLNRRNFLGKAALGMTGVWLGWMPTRRAHAQGAGWDPDRPFPRIGRTLRVHPVFLYRLPTPKAQASWRSWGGIQSAEEVTVELERLAGELGQLAAHADFPLEILPVTRVTSAEDLGRESPPKADVTLLYACTGSGDLLRAVLAARPDTIVFVRHRSGPTYYWYEALSTHYLATGTDRKSPAGVTAHVEDVVVDDYGEVLWRLRALFGVNQLRGCRVVALGGAWGKYAADAPQQAKERYQLEIVDVSYETFAARLQEARADLPLHATLERWVDRYLGLPGTVLETDRRFVVNAFLLYRLFQDLLAEHRAPVFTIKSCMGTIIPMAETTACLSLGLLNDEGQIAFCESDFVIIPAGILVRYIAGKPVFLHNSTFPHQGMVTCAHCTCPRRLDGRRYEPARLLTHYESDYGAAPKVEMPLGQPVTFLNPEYSQPRWVGFTGKIEGNPTHAICRSQQDVRIDGAWPRLLREVRDSHWIMVYGDYLKELAYAARKLGIHWADLS